MFKYLGAQCSGFVSNGTNTMPAPTEPLFVGQNYTYKCKENFVPVFLTMDTIHCLENKTYSGEPLECTGKLKVYAFKIMLVITTNM